MGLAVPGKRSPKGGTAKMNNIQKKALKAKFSDGLGYCAYEEHHYYADVKAAYKLLTDDAKDCFLNRDMYKAALARLET